MQNGRPSRQLLFVHGAGGYVEDRPLADALGLAAGADVVMPRLPDDDMSVEAWAARVRAALDAVGPDALVVGHSFGATILLSVLREAGRASGRRLALLAMPDWGPGGWDIDAYALDGPEPGCPISLHHCRDDGVVPFSHLALNATKLPGAGVAAHDTGGHQFEGRAATIAAWLTSR